MVGEAREALPAAGDDYAKMEAVQTVLYRRRGFEAAADDYYNPDNSFLSEVLARRRGIPITLCLVYRQLAAGLGLDLQCVGMPGHFLLKYDRPLHPLYIDAYNSGIILLEDGCRDKLHELFEGRIEFKPEMLRAVSKREVLLRMLTNLKQIYREAGDALRLVRVLNRRIPLMSDPLGEILERGVARLGLDLFRGALEDFETFVELTDDDQMRELISEQLGRLRILAAGN